MIDTHQCMDGVNINLSSYSGAMCKMKDLLTDPRSLRYTSISR